MAVRAISETLRMPCAKHSFLISLYSSAVRRKLIVLLLDSMGMEVESGAETPHVLQTCPLFKGLEGGQFGEAREGGGRWLGRGVVWERV